MRYLYDRKLFLASLILILSLLGITRANTEVINFAPTRAPSVDLSGFRTSRWEKLNSEDGTRQFALPLAPYGQPWPAVCEHADCQHELFIELPLGDVEEVDWNWDLGYSLRVSWPASTPADFSLEIYTPMELLRLLHSRISLNDTVPTAPLPQTFTTYARIRARDAGVPAPRNHKWQIFPPLVPPLSTQPTVHFHIILDPLLLGFLPRSALPVVCLVIGAVAVGMYVSNRLVPCLGNIAKRVDAAALLSGNVGKKTA
ncbi:hypothetical protein RhiJN_16379 [Ceratobasidium sp. AG-Ba]|nr:hypothetical protein RhiJN_16379 [Ceratobasidium sp. AG-Ba]